MAEPSDGRWATKNPPAGGSLCSAAGGGDVGEPGAGLALGLGDLPGAHFLGDVGPAFLRLQAAVERGEVEPRVRFDEVDVDAAAARRISDAEIVERLDVPRHGLGDAAFYQESCGFRAMCHLLVPFWCVSWPHFRPPITNKWLTTGSGISDG